ncbi:unnamed protein product [Lactuca virosa]|uniref:Uncharacterized protein n=1 Tax=Lactuca virosa TaxID=75947 RepID=A0AAU9N890_9ASTR|nr:unnamed protein product [Lactuca virosa]
MWGFGGRFYYNEEGGGWTTVTSGGSMWQEPAPVAFCCSVFLFVPTSYELVMRGGVGKDVSDNNGGNGWMWFALAAQGNTMVDASGDFWWFPVAVGGQGWQFLATLGSLFGS